MKIDVINGEARLSKRNILKDVNEKLEFLLDNENLQREDYETIAVIFHDMYILAEIIAVEEKDSDNYYPFLGSCWEIKKKQHGL